jgi:hypothetical protein
MIDQDAKRRLEKARGLTNGDLSKIDHALREVLKGVERARWIFLYNDLNRRLRKALTPKKATRRYPRTKRA